MVVAEVLLFVRLSVQFQQLKAENHPEMAVLQVLVLRTVSTEMIVVRRRTVLASEVSRDSESPSYLPRDLDKRSRAITHDNGEFMTVEERERNAALYRGEKLEYNQLLIHILTVTLLHIT